MKRVEPHYGYLTLYDKDDYERSFDVVVKLTGGALDIVSHCKMLKKYLKHIPSELKESTNTDHPLIGMNSNSFIELPELKIELLGPIFKKEAGRRHNLFLERDGEDFTEREREEIGGMVIKTDKGMHIIREDCLTLEQLLKLQKKYRCCEGFMRVTSERRYACLRLCPKGNNRLKIIHKPEGQFYNIYEQFIKILHQQVK